MHVSHTVLLATPIQTETARLNFMIVQYGEQVKGMCSRIKHRLNNNDDLIIMILLLSPWN